MLARLEQQRAPLTEAEARRARHLVFVLPKTDKGADLAGVPFVRVLEAALKRRRKKLADLAKSSITTDLPQGALVSWVVDDAGRSVFERLTTFRKALQPLL